MEALWAPHPDTAGTSLLPSLKAEYVLPSEADPRAVSLLITYTQDGNTHDEDSYHRTYTYVDGLGRTVATLSEADPIDDGFGWVVDGLTDYDQKGAERRKYLAWTYDDPPETYDLSLPSPAKYGKQRYDAFGRAVQTHGLDGRTTLLTKYSRTKR